MDTKRFAEYYLCDAMRLAQLLGGEDATISEGMGNADDFPLIPRMREQVGDDVRFLRSDGEDYYEVAYVSDSKPRPEDSKFRNKSYYRVVIGRGIKKARKEVGMTISQLSQLTNLREHSLLRIEEGMWDLDVSMLGVILDALRKTIKIV